MRRLDDRPPKVPSQMIKQFHASHSDTETFKRILPGVFCFFLLSLYFITAKLNCLSGGIERFNVLNTVSIRNLCFLLQKKALENRSIRPMGDPFSPFWWDEGRKGKKEVS